MILAIGPAALGGLGTKLAAAAVTVFAALSYATSGIYARRFPQFSPFVIAAGQLVVACIVLVPLSLTLDAPLSLRPEQGALFALLVVAIVNTAIPVLLLFWLVRTAGATNTSLLAFFMPVAAVLLGVLVLEEDLPMRTLAGFGLIILGAAFVTGNLGFPRRRTV